MGKIAKGVALGAVVGIATGGVGLALGAAGVAGASASTFALASSGFLGIGSTLLASAAAGGILGGLSGAARQFQKKPSMDMSAASNRLTVGLDPNAPGKWGFGGASTDKCMIFGRADARH